MKKIEIFDSTLRDGAQETGITFSLADKINVVKLLDEAGIDYIEGGNPGSNPKDAEFYDEIKKITLIHSKIVAFGSTRRKDIKAEDDANLKALVESGAKTCVIFGKSSVFHVENVIRATPDENLKMIADSCRYLRSSGIEVIFDCEHFFDGFKENSEYAMESIKAATDNGAGTVCLCDTNGGTFPSEVKDIVQYVRKHTDSKLAVHFHNDSGMAVANSVIAVRNGADQVQGTFLGIGERCGNANLTTIIPDLQLKLGYECIEQGKLKNLTKYAHEMAEINNSDLPQTLPYVGDNAFAHKAGMHADGVLKSTRSFEHVDPELIGNRRKFPTSEISGKAVIYERIKNTIPELNVESEQMEAILGDIKRMENEGYEFETADASFELLVRRHFSMAKPFFTLINYRIYTGVGTGEEYSASATVKVRVGNEVKLMAAEGNGPVNALDIALRKALEEFYPVLKKIKLIDYRVRVLDSKKATAATVRVLMTSTDGRENFSTVGVSGDVVDASWKALSDSINYILQTFKAGKPTDLSVG
jgi:2-isopropylmalate synthase